MSATTITPRVPLSERATLGMLQVRGAVEDRAQRGADEGSRLRWVWVVLIGVLVIAAAAGFVYCKARGYDGFNGNIEAVKGPFGVKIGVKIGCY